MRLGISDSLQEAQDHGSTCRAAHLGACFCTSLSSETKPAKLDFQAMTAQHNLNWPEEPGDLCVGKLTCNAGRLTEAPAMPKEQAEQYVL